MAQSATTSRTEGRTFALAASALLALVLAFSMFASGNVAYGAQSAAAGPSDTPSAISTADTPTLWVANAATGKVTLKKGASYKLGATASAGKIKYKSSAPKVVSVNSKGKLKAKKPGKANITVSVKNVTTTIKVTVVKAKKFKAVKSISATATKTALAIGETTKTKVTFKPAKVSNKNLVYTSSDENVATVDTKGRVTGVGAGTATITAKSSSNRKATAAVLVTVAAPESAPAATEPEPAPEPEPEATEPEPAPEPEPEATNPFNTGKIDLTAAAIGEDTPGLATIEEAVAFNPIEQDPATASTAVTFSMKTATYLTASDSGKDVDLKVEVLIPSNAAPARGEPAFAPLVVWINGGGFTGSDASNNLQYRLDIARQGFVVASVQHRVGASATFPTAIQDIKAAIRFLKANASAYSFDPNLVAVAGNSSGGYYATMIGVTSNVKTIQFNGRPTDLDVGANLDQSSAVNAVVDFYGVSDLTIIGANLENKALSEGHKSAATTEALLLNGAAAARKGVGVFDVSMEDKVAAASPFTYIDPSDPPFIIFHGTADTLVSPVASKMLQNRLQEAGVSADRYVITGAGHGGNQFYTTYVTEKVGAFLKANATKALPDEIAYIEGDASKGKLLEYDAETGEGSYKAEAGVPALADAIAGEDTVEVDADKWVINQAKDVTYKTIRTSGTYTSLKMHIYTPSKAGDRSPRPVLYCPANGGFSSSSYDDMSLLRYAERGYVVAVAEIRVVPSSTQPGPIQDAKAGVRWLRANAGAYNIDPDCIITLGRSAAGYYATMLGVLSNTTQLDDKTLFDTGDNLEYSSAVQGVVDQYGVSDFTIIGAGLPNYGVHDSESNTEALIVNGTAFGANPGGSVFSNFEKTAQFSPFTYIDGEDPSFLILHGDTNDTLVSPIASMELYKRLTAAGVDAERHTLVGMGHGGWQIQTDKVLGMIDDYMDGVVAANAK